MSDPIPPQCVVLAGPNGAGKSTAAPFLLSDAMRLTRFLNADTIARGLSAYEPDDAATRAGRILLDTMDDYAAAGLDFATETTLSGRSPAALRPLSGRSPAARWRTGCAN